MDAPESWTSDDFDREFEAVKALTSRSCQAIFWKDEPLHESLRISVAAQLDEMLAKYPSHPELLQLRGIYSETATETITFYRQAIEAALCYDMPAYEIRLSLADWLMTSLRAYAEPKLLLDQAKPELMKLGDESELSWFAQLSDELESVRLGHPCSCGQMLKELTEPRCPHCGEDWD